MDLEFEDRKLHIPPELLTNICSFLSPIGPESDVSSARLVNRSFCTAATPALTNTCSSPAELFLSPTCRRTCETWSERLRCPIEVLSIWTWLRIPATVTVEGEGAANRCGPYQEIEGNERYRDRWAYLRSFERRVHGRFGAFWARMREDTDLFCIILLWHCRSCWDAYRHNEGVGEVPGLPRFLKSKAPSCATTSWSESALLHLATPFPLRLGYHEIRTIYFRSDLPLEHKPQIENALCVNTVLSQFEHRSGPTTVWCWLPGFRTYDGQLTVALRWLFLWKSEDVERTYYDEMKARRGAAWLWIPGEDPNLKLDQALDILESNGMIGFKILHADFHYGPVEMDYYPNE